MGEQGGGESAGASRRSLLLRLNGDVAEALSRWAGDELRSTNAHIELLLRRALAEAGRLPARVDPIAKRGRPPKSRGTTEPE